MNNLSIIACVGKNLELGKDNDLIWHIPNDLKYFRKVTNGKIVVMGRNTYLSVPKLLPNRVNIILQSKKRDNVEGAIIYNDFDKLLKDLLEKDEEVFIIGGASIYKLFIPYADKLYLTEVYSECNDASVYFPKFDKRRYHKDIISSETYEDLKYDFVVYQKIKKTK